MLILFPFLLSLFTPTDQAGMKYLALGDSYTIGESVAEADRWPNQLVERWSEKGIHVSKPRIIATTGWRTDDLSKAVAEAHLSNDYDIVSLLIGVNNQYQGKPLETYKTEFEELLKTSIRLAKGNASHVFVVSIPDYGYTPFGKAKQEKISRELDQYNEVAKQIAAKYHVTYVYITDISRKALEDTALVAPDTLHPSGKMYTQWVEKILKEFSLK